MGRHYRKGGAAVRERLMFAFEVTWAALPLWVGIGFGIWFSMSGR